MQRIINTSTNIFFILGGLVLPLFAGVYLLIMGIASGVHHWFQTRFTQVLDYAAMYGVCYAIIIIGLGWPFWIAAILAGGTAIAWEASRVVIGVLIAGAMIVLAAVAGIEPMMHVSAYLAIGFVFNSLGDTKLLGNYHGLLHGAGWHIPVGYACMLAFQYLLG